ncbi:MAG TPA: PLP-dependent transferase [Vicinamibacterales bacterium]|nr:PLP-dependent transferase [Vicinamibacterales bacterium]
MARRIDTECVHGGEPRRKAHDSLTNPLVLATTYPFASTDELRRYFRGEYERTEEYGRYGNPTQRVAEGKLAALEGGGRPGVDALLTASGMSAVVTTLLAILRPGMHVVITGDVYRKTRIFVREFLSRFGVEHTSCEPSVGEIEKSLKPNTKLIVTESPTNPYLNCVDLEALAALARARNIKSLVDATLATPLNVRPLEHGVDLVLHSATKYLGGHNDLMAGALIGADHLISATREYHGMFGAVVSPFSAYLMIRGLKTLALRVRQHNASGQRIAEFLEGHPRVDRVWYPGLKSHPSHEIAARQMAGFGGVISFTVKGSGKDASRVVDAAQIPYLAPSLGGAESFIEQPALMSYYDKAPEELEAIGIRPELIRLSVGLEDADDLIADLDQALSHV